MNKLNKKYLMQSATKQYYTNQNIKPATPLLPAYENTSVLGAGWSNMTLKASKSNKSLSR